MRVKGPRIARFIVPVLAAFCTDLHGTERPGLIEGASVPKRFIVRHSSPSIGAALASAKRSAGVRTLGASSAKSLALSAGTAISSEQKEFVSALKYTGVGATKLKISHLRQALNATIIAGLSSSDAAALERAGYRLEPEIPVHAMLFDSVPLIGTQSAWSRLDANARQLTGHGIRVGIIDTGIDYTHSSLGACTSEQFLASKCPKVAGGYDFVHGDPDPMDDHSHGTHVAGIVAGNGALPGVAPDAVLYAYKVLDASGAGSSADIIAAIERAADPNGDGDSSDHLDVINLSLGGLGDPDDVLSQAVDGVEALGVIPVAAAGNSGPGERTIGSPAAARSAITVGATYARNELAPLGPDLTPKMNQITFFSSRGPVEWDNGQKVILKPDIVAPGGRICAPRATALSSSKFPLCHDENHVSLSGTSMAAPHVAGAAALLKQANPGALPGEIKAALKGSAISLNEPAKGIPYPVSSQGVGRLDVGTAVARPLPPIARIDSEGILLAERRVSIRGTASGPGVNSYTIEYQDRNRWKRLCTGSSPVEQGVLCTVNTEPLSGKRLLLRLSVSNAWAKAVEFGYLSFRRAYISSPRTSTLTDAHILGNADFIVRGFAGGRSFKRYSLALCPLVNSQSGSCRSDGITLIDRGTKPVDGILAIVRPSQVPFMGASYYLLRLTVIFARGKPESYESKVFIDPALARSFPLPGVGKDSILLKQPLITDLEGDGSLEIIVSYPNTITVTDTAGRFRPGFPVHVPRLIQTPPLAADLDGDGIKEVIARDNEGYIYVLNGRGEYLDGWPRQASMTHFGVLTAADVDGDGKSELLVSERDILDYQGKDRWGLRSYNVFYPTVVVGDFVPAPGKEVAFVGFTIDPPTSVVAMYRQTGEFLWTTSASGIVSFGATAAVDLDGDGLDELIFASQNNTEPAGGYIHALRGDGTAAPGFPVAFTAKWQAYRGSIDMAVGDLDGDARPEIATTACGSLWVVDYRGNISPTLFGVGQSVSGMPTIANVDGDLDKEIIVPSFASTGSALEPSLDEIVAYNGDGTIAYGFPKYGNSFVASNHVPVLDIDADGKNEVIGLDGNLNIWKLEACNNPREEWAQGRRDDAQTGRYAGPTDRCEASYPLAAPQTKPVTGGASLLMRAAHRGFYEIVARQGGEQRRLTSSRPVSTMNLAPGRWMVKYRMRTSLEHGAFSSWSEERTVTIRRDGRSRRYSSRK